jgi:hypothetical protein
MSAILAIDPGTTKSAYMLILPDEPLHFAITANEDVLAMIRQISDWTAFPTVVIEQVASYGMPVGAEVFETVYWSGRFAEAAHPLPVERITRLQVKNALCHDSRASDATIRRELMDRYGGDSSIRKGGVLYGVSKDVWAALAVAVAWSDGVR